MRARGCTRLCPSRDFNLYPWRPEIELNAKKRYCQVEDSDGAEWFLNEENIMNQKILANFNLNQSLEEFQVSRIGVSH